MTISTRIDRHGNPRYRVRVRVFGRYAGATFRRLKDARAWGRAQERDLHLAAAPASVQARQRRLGDAVRRYVAEELPNKAPGTAAVQRLQLARWVELLGDVALAAVRPLDVAEAKHKLQATVGPATVRRYLSALSRLFTVACREWEWCNVNPVLLVSRPREPQGRVRWLDSAERLRLLYWVERSSDPRLLPVVLLAIATGARSRELLSLQWSQLDLDRGRIYLNKTKNGNRRALHLSGQALELLRKMQAAALPAEKQLFPPKRFDACDPDIDYSWQKARAQAGLKDFRFHDLRHTFASYLAMTGATEPEIAEALGNNMARRYAHLCDSHTATVVDRMAKRFQL